MGTKLSLTEVKTISFEILKHFKAFCDENDICFYLSNGTLLGAIKYGGFIPWDDDIDVLVPREDYDRLIRMYHDNNKYRLFSMEREQNFRFPFAKLCDVTTLKEEININNGVQLGIDIDIFPLDCCTSHILRPSIQKRIKIFQIGRMLSKFSTSKGKPFYKRCIIDYCRMRGYAFFQNRFSTLITKESSLGSTHMGCLVWPIYGEKEILPAEIFSDTIEVEFEGEMFHAPIGYDKYLRSLYGDYEQDPPLEKQLTHHNFTAYRI